MTTETANRRNALAITIGIHALLIAICAWFIGIKPPNPPIPDYGVEVNFGIDDTGFGDQQTTSYSPTEPTPEQNQTETNQASPQESEAATEQLATTTDAESPAEVKDEPKKNTETAKTEPLKTQTTNPTKSSATAASNAPKGNTGSNNNGDKPGTSGDMGKPTGDLSSLNYNGDGGKSNKPGAGGASLQLNGWRWDDKPDKKDPYNETGKIVFQIKVDAEGNIIEVKPIEKTVSPDVVAFYREQVEKLTFSKTKENTDAAEVSVGKITFIIKGN